MLDYIRTSIEILMQMKLDEEKLAAATSGLAKQHVMKRDTSGVMEQNSSLSSTLKSLEPPPVVYEG